MTAILEFIQNHFIVAALIKMVIVLVFMLLLMVPFMIWLERKVIADMQIRIGPNRTGPYGLLQPIADGIKLFFKEDVLPANVDRAIYFLAPAINVVPALTLYCVIPFGTLGIGGGTAVTNVNVGILLAFSLMSVSVYGIVLAGWASNNKYSLLGGLRASAQMISYELSLGLSIIGVLMLAGTLDLMGIAQAQSGSFHGFPRWFLFVQPLGFLIYLISAFAETNRVPFDLPEAEGELVAGYHTEYSSMKFAMFFMGEYAFVVAHAAIATTLFLGGWNPIIPAIPLPGIVWFGMKIFAFAYFFVWVRATLPRFRFDQLMHIGWKILLPLALVNLFATGIGIVIWQSLAR
ncbi:MAG TPA: NADH-quinone oxidoreductase subunit NuoH [Armatimonadota bacterium]|jgi:NADH-quinone oxidoreductase subunit H